ncbi:MAG TPA: spore coat protein [Clostridiales bacterium]|jgi:rubrerythrin|nr:spore coat protein [Clostridiales bacterium]
MQFSQKETELLKDLKGQEKLCADKYTRHAQAAADPQLRDLLGGIAKVERGHYDTITQIEGGTVPQPGQDSQQQPTFKAVYGTTEDEKKKNDSYICTDLLSMEKHVSHMYDTCIFEFRDQNVRNVLNHIQKEEQTHGKLIYDYMQTNNMYS